MDNIAELEKYKALLDAGAITEDEFKRMKQSLLGLKTDEEKEMERQAEREEALKEIEALKQQKAAEENTNERVDDIKVTENESMFDAEQIESEQNQFEYGMESPKQEEDIDTQKIFETEKLKEKARLQAATEVKNANRAKYVNTTTSVVSKVFFWILTVLCLFVSLGSFMNVADDVAYNLLWGFFFLLFAIMACPYITTKTRDMEALSVYYKYKKVIAIGLFILFFVISSIMS